MPLALGRQVLLPQAEERPTLDLSKYVGQPATPATLAAIRAEVQVAVDTETSNAWPAWVDATNYSVTTSGTSTSATITWNAWVDDSTCATYSTGSIWQGWVVTNDSTTGSGTIDLNNGPVFTAWLDNDVRTVRRAHRRGETWRQRVEALMTPEEREEQERKRREREEARRIEREEKMKQREAAILKAEKLLRSCLTAEQEATLDKDHYFDVKGGKTGTKYRIRRGRHINIEVLGKRGRVERKLCFAPRVDCPDADAMLCQKLMLELDEDAALKVAIKHSSGTGVQHGQGDRIVPRERREEIIAEVVPIDRARRAA